MVVRRAMAARPVQAACFAELEYPERYLAGLYLHPFPYLQLLPFLYLQQVAHSAGRAWRAAIVVAGASAESRRRLVHLAASVGPAAVGVVVDSAAVLAAGQLTRPVKQLRPCYLEWNSLLRAVLPKQFASIAGSAVRDSPRSAVTDRGALVMSSHNMRNPS